MRRIGGPYFSSIIAGWRERWPAASSAAHAVHERPVAVRHLARAALAAEVALDSMMGNPYIPGVGVGEPLRLVSMGRSGRRSRSSKKCTPSRRFAKPSDSAWAAGGEGVVEHDVVEVRRSTPAMRNAFSPSIRVASRWVRSRIWGDHQVGGLPAPADETRRSAQSLARSARVSTTAPPCVRHGEYVEEVEGIADPPSRARPPPCRWVGGRFSAATSAWRPPAPLLEGGAVSWCWLIMPKQAGAPADREGSRSCRSRCA